jgi:hypothetical protein
MAHDISYSHYITLITLFLGLFFVRCNQHRERFHHCPLNQTNINGRTLLALTCDNGGIRPFWKGSDAIQTWNITSRILRSHGMNMTNVCVGRSWDYGFLTKTVSYREYLERFIASNTIGIDNLYIMLTDSDTIWSATSILEIWNRFDCARGQKEILVSSEMGCWMGYYCNQHDIDTWYNHVKNSTTYSPFVNSGVIMGKVTKIRDMLNYILAHNDSYFTYDKRVKKMRYHDQHATGDYSLRVAKDLVAIDVHQQFSGSFCVHVSENRNDSLLKSVCKRKDGSIDFHCKDYSANIRDRSPKHFRVNESSCIIYRHLRRYYPYYEQLHQLALRPIIWHGNGPGKRTYVAMGQAAVQCYRAKGLI